MRMLANKVKYAIAAIVMACSMTAGNAWAQVIGGQFGGNTIVPIENFTSSANPAPYGQSVTLTATAYADGSTRADGTFTLYDGNTVLGTKFVNDDGTGHSTFSFTTDPNYPLAEGIHNMYVTWASEYVVNLTETGNFPQTVTQPTGGSTVTLTSSASWVRPGTPVTFTAWASGVTGGTIIFYDGTTVLGASLGAAGSLTTSSLLQGAHNITAGYIPPKGNYTVLPGFSNTLIEGVGTSITDWANPADITYGTPLSSTQLNATAIMPGTFTYTPAAGTVLQAGQNQTLSMSFTPSDPNIAKLGPTGQLVFINVNKATPKINWTPSPATIAVNAPLSSGQLNASATDPTTGNNVPGTLSYTPASGGTFTSAGTQTLSVTFTPTDTTDYKSATATVNINVINQITPTITWANPADISYGTPLGSAQLNATTSVPGNFTYSPAAGSTLNAGQKQTLSVTFTPTDTTAYKSATATTKINVAQGTPTIAFPTPTDISYGTALSSTQLDATATDGSGNSVPGTFTYSPAAGTMLKVGKNQTLSVKFKPADTTNYVTPTSSTTTTINVNQTTPTITWANPADITIGTALSSTQLDATATVNGTTVPGTFTYNPASGTQLSIGNNQTLNVKFTPTDTTDYVTVTATATINVNPKQTPTITWTNPADITYGTTLGSSQLDATATVNGTTVPGTFTYTPASGTKLNAGQKQTLSVSFTPNDTADYTTATGTATINVAQAAPTVNWSTPAAIPYGTALSSTQLNATASVPGTFSYSPAAGTQLNAGNNQTLSVTFTPTDTANYTTPTSPTTTTINVTQATPTIFWGTPADITVGTALSSTQLDAIAANASGNNIIPGSYSYTLSSGAAASGATLNVGNSQVLIVTFTPTDTTDYATTAAYVLINVRGPQTTPTITWNNPADIDSNTPLGSAQLNATATVPGKFVYSPAAGTVLNAGNGQTLSVTFTPTDTTDYTTATKSVSINVSSKKVPTITWSNPADITYGTLLSATQLKATASVAGKFVYSPATGIKLSAGQGQPLSVTFTPTDTTNYATVTTSVYINVNQITPTVTWATPAAIATDIALSGTQLKATASVAGSFAYTPAAGTTLPAGTQPLSVTFTPNDPNYAKVTKAVNIIVNPITTTTTLAAKYGSTAITSNVTTVSTSQAVIFTATVKANDGSTPTGTVTLFDEGTQLGNPVPLNNGAAIFPGEIFKKTGTHDIEATYNEDGNGNDPTSTSALFDLKIALPVGRTP